MLSNISWGDFFTYLILAVVLYYAAIGLLFYRQQLSALFSGKGSGLSFKRTGPGGTQAQAEKSAGIKSAVHQEENHYLPDSNNLENILNVIRYDVIPKAGDHPTKAKLAIVYQHYLETLSGNFTVTAKDSINKLMVQEAIEQCGISFREEELLQLW